METRTFRIVPVRRGSEIEVIDILDKQQPRQNNHRPDFECEEEDDDSLMLCSTPAASSSNTSSTDNCSLRERMELLERSASHSVDTMDSRDDEVSLPMVFCSYNRKDHRSPRVQQQFLERQQQQHQKAPTETEKRIAQLRSAGLSISTRSLPPLSSPRIGDQRFRSPRYKKKERQSPLSVPFDPGFRTNGLASNQCCSPLQALLEKDKHRQRGKVSPPTPRSIRARLSALAPKTPPPPPPRLQEFADPIIVARPAYKGMRVSRKEYPDPEAFGWTFVGSCGEVEFFENKSSEKGLVVILEFHYTTGTVKATLEHPLWGESLLAFAQGGSKVSLAPEIYRKILLDPLGCTNASRGGKSLST